MEKPGRNDPCPCGSGKKFKHCHLGREEELLVIQTEKLKQRVAGRITALPQVDYGRAPELARSVDIQELTGNSNFSGIRFIDFSAYVALESFDKGRLKNVNQRAAALTVNPEKTQSSDPDHIYLAVTPEVHDSTLIHELAHVLTFLGPHGLLPGSTYQLGLQTGIPTDHLDHPKEFGDWLHYLKERFDIELDAEDAIVSYLHRNDMLIESELIKSKDAFRLTVRSRAILEFLEKHRDEIDGLIQNRIGYAGSGK